MASTSKVPKQFWNFKRESFIDRISSLSDDLLIDILSFLPTKYAVATSVLAKRWRYLFKEVHNLDFDDSLLFDRSKCVDHSKNSTAFRGFVDKMLSCCKLSDVIRLRLKCGSESCGSTRSKCDCSDLNAWVHVALSHGIKELDICIGVPQSVTLPASIITCNTLRVIKLKAPCVLDIPGSVCLPNVKILHLSKVCFPDDDSLSRLFSGCPLLEEFKVKENMWRNVDKLTISAPSLRKLKLDFREGFGQAGHRDLVAIDAPLLECFHYVDNLADSYSIRVSNSLVQARLYIFTDMDLVEESPVSIPAVELIGGISCVKHLVLSDHFIEALTDAEFELPILPSLTKLELGYSEYLQWEYTLPIFFEIAPYLQELMFPEGLHLAKVEEEEEDCEADPRQRLQDLPSCLQTCLKIIKIEHFLGLEEELRMVQHLLKHAKVLERLIIHCHSSKGAEKSQLRNKLMKWPRGSEACLITCN